MFVQETEPEGKNGIWLDYDGTPEKIIASDSVVEAPSWLPDGTVRNIPYSPSYTKRNFS